MKLKLSENWTKKLLKYQETGMGYQKVDVVLKDGTIIEDAIILNAEILVLSGQYGNLKLEEISDISVKK